MKFKSNQIKEVICVFRQELSGLYDNREIDNFIYLLFEHHLGFSRTDMILKSEDTVNESILIKIHSAIKHLMDFKPIQYIIGKAHFYGMDFTVNNNVLIPRPETEELVDLIIKNHTGKQPVSILDIGTGSGCMAIALKKHITDATVYAIDISEKALEVAQQNAQQNATEVIFLTKDILNPASLLDLPSFDMIVSNPPYVRESEKGLMSKNVLDYEPAAALFVSDENPLIFYKAIAEFSAGHLKANGKLYLEINENLPHELSTLFTSKGFTNHIIKDLHEKDRFLVNF